TLVANLKKAYPKPAAKAKAKAPTDAERLAQSERDRTDITAILFKTSSPAVKKTLTAQLETLDKDVLEIRTNLRSKIEATAKQLASLLKQAQSADELPKAAFWKSLHFPFEVDVKNWMKKVAAMTPEQAKTALAGVDAAIEEIERQTAKPKNGKKTVGTANFPSKKVHVNQPQA